MAYANSHSHRNGNGDGNWNGNVTFCLLLLQSTLVDWFIQLCFLPTRKQSCAVSKTIEKVTGAKNQSRDFLAAIIRESKVATLLLSSQRLKVRNVLDSLPFPVTSALSVVPSIQYY